MTDPVSPSKVDQTHKRKRSYAICEDEKPAPAPIVVYEVSTIDETVDSMAKETSRESEFLGDQLQRMDLRKKNNSVGDTDADDFPDVFMYDANNDVVISKKNTVKALYEMINEIPSRELNTLAFSPAERMATLKANTISGFVHQITNNFSLAELDEFALKVVKLKSLGSFTSSTLQSLDSVQCANKATVCTPRDSDKIARKSAVLESIIRRVEKHRSMVYSVQFLQLISSTELSFFEQLEFYAPESKLFRQIALGSYSLHELEKLDKKIASYECSMDSSLTPESSSDSQDGSIPNSDLEELANDHNAARKCMIESLSSYLKKERMECMTLSDLTEKEELAIKLFDDQVVFEYFIEKFSTCELQEFWIKIAGSSISLQMPERRPTIYSSSTHDNTRRNASNKSERVSRLVEGSSNTPTNTNRLQGSSSSSASSYCHDEINLKPLVPQFVPDTSNRPEEQETVILKEKQKAVAEIRKALDKVSADFIPNFRYGLSDNELRLLSYLCVTPQHQRISKRVLMSWSLENLRRLAQKVIFQAYRKDLETQRFPIECPSQLPPSDPSSAVPIQNSVFTSDRTTRYHADSTHSKRFDQNGVSFNTHIKSSASNDYENFPQKTPGVHLNLINIREDVELINESSSAFEKDALLLHVLKQVLHEKISTQDPVFYEAFNESEQMIIAFLECPPADISSLMKYAQLKFNISQVRDFSGKIESFIHTKRHLEELKEKLRRIEISPKPSESVLRGYSIERKDDESVLLVRSIMEEISSIMDVEVRKGKRTRYPELLDVVFSPKERRIVSPTRETNVFHIVKELFTMEELNAIKTKTTVLKKLLNSDTVSEDETTRPCLLQSLLKKLRTKKSSVVDKPVFSMKELTFIASFEFMLQSFTVEELESLDMKVGIPEKENAAIAPPNKPYSARTTVLETELPKGIHQKKAMDKSTKISVPVEIADSVRPVQQLASLPLDRPILGSAIDSSHRATLSSRYTTASNSSKSTVKHVSDNDSGKRNPDSYNRQIYAEMPQVLGFFAIPTGVKTELGQDYHPQVLTCDELERELLKGADQVPTDSFEKKGKLQPKESEELPKSFTIPEEYIDWYLTNFCSPTPSVARQSQKKTSSSTTNASSSGKTHRYHEPLDSHQKRGKRFDKF